MVADPNRYDSLRDATREAQDRTGPNEQHAAKEEAGRQTDAEVAENGPARPLSPPFRLPSYPAYADMESQQAAASRDAAARNEYLNAGREIKPEPPPQPEVASHDLSSSEDQAQARNYNDLKIAQAKATETTEPVIEQEKVAPLENNGRKLISYEDECRERDSKSAPPRENEKPLENAGRKLIYYEDINSPELEHQR